MSDISQKTGFMTVEDVMEALQVKQATAYSIMRKLNSELQEMGLITIHGRVDANYFRKKMFYGE